MNTIESENMAILKERDAQLALYVEQTEPIEFHIKESMRLAKEGVKWMNLGQQGVVLLMGFGNGSFAKELVRKMNPGHKLIIYEPDLGKFRYALSRYPFEDVLRSPQATIILGEVKEFGFVYLYHEFMINGHLWVVKNKYAVEDSTKGEMLDFFLLKFIEEKKFWDTNIGTQLNIGKNFTNSILHNVPSIMKAKSTERLRDQCKGKPALVISTGPSLELCFDSIRKAKGKMVLISVDTSAQLLIDNGIEPDLICGIDPLHDNLALFQTDEVRALPFVAMSQYTPEVLEQHKGPLFVSGMLGNPIYSWLHWFWEDKGNPDCFGGSVSHYGTTIAELLGCDTIGLIGQDLSFKTKTHAGDVAKKLHEFEGLEVPDETKTSASVKNNLGEDVFTKGNFLSFKTAFENKIRNTPHLKYYNFTKGGLNIEGAENTDLDEYLATLSHDDNLIIDWPEYEPMYKIDGAITRLEEGIKLLSKIRKASLVILKYIHKMKDLRAMGKNKYIPKIATKVEKWLRPKTQHPFTAVLAQYHVQLELYLRRYDISSIDQIKEKWKRFDNRIDRGLNYYGELIEGCEILRDNIKICLNKLKEMRDATTHQSECEQGLGEEAIEAQGVRG